MWRKLILVLMILLLSTGYASAGWVTLDYPGATTTHITGIDGSNLVGAYYDSGGDIGHGFIYTVPEPATLLLFGLGAATVKRRVFERGKR